MVHVRVQTVQCAALLQLCTVPTLRPHSPTRMEDTLPQSLKCSPMVLSSLFHERLPTNTVQLSFASGAAAGAGVVGLTAAPFSAFAFLAAGCGHEVRDDTIRCVSELWAGICKTFSVCVLKQRAVNTVVGTIHSGLKNSAALLSLGVEPFKAVGLHNAPLVRGQHVGCILYHG